MLEPLTSAEFVLIKARCRENDCREERRTRSDEHTHAHTHAQRHTLQDTASSHRGVCTCSNTTKQWETEMSSETAGEGFCSASVQELQNFLGKKKKKEKCSNRLGQTGAEGRGVNSGTEKWNEEACEAGRATRPSLKPSISWKKNARKLEVVWCLILITSIWTHLGF